MPTHGKNGNVFVRNENGFIGSGLDDLTFGVFSSATDSSLSCNGMISSSQAITTTARNSNPLARCMVLIET